MREISIEGKRNTQISDPGPAPMLQWINIGDLVIDDDYQRDLKRGNWTAIRRIADAFTWSRFSPVFVAPVEGGKFAIIDGQHRVHAAALCGIDRVPCQVVQMDKREQAASFAAVNGMVTAVTIWQLYKAALAAGEQWAIDCYKVCDDAGAKLSTYNKSSDEKKPGEIFAIGLIRKHVDAGHGAMLTLALTALARSECGGLPEAWSGSIPKPFFEAVAPRTYLRGRVSELAEAIDDIDILTVADDAERDAKEARRKGDTSVSRAGLAEARIAHGIDDRLGPVAQTAAE